MNTSKRPYFFWDYPITEADVHRMLKTGTDWERRWVMARILSHAAYDDVWNYLKPQEIAQELPHLRMRPYFKNAWNTAVTVWGYHVPITA